MKEVMANRYMVNCEQALMREIENRRIFRRDVAHVYALALRSPEWKKVNWATVNRAIMNRWSKSGLEWIKKQAWSGKEFQVWDYRIGEAVTLSHYACCYDPRLIEEQ